MAPGLPSRRKPDRGRCPLSTPAERRWRGDYSRFVPQRPPHSALALLARDGGECEWRREKREKKVLP